ncbi:MAG TPA: efflux RND transporter periplasmic adaptor subunit [Candidatus Dormibacteraeota bacterium]|nr:efflux RND transporter periplasmic adaptor subunit [Candidatus Dormibacteraeota bacterium]
MTRRKWLCAETVQNVGPVFSALMIAAMLMAAGCSGGGSDQAKEPEMTAEVTVTKVKRADIRQMVTVSGNVVALPNKDVKVSALVAGRITELNVSEGDRIHAGEVLAEIDSHTYQDQLRQAQAALAQATATVQNAQQNLARNQTLFQRGIAAGKDLEDAKTQLSVAEATQHQAEAAEETARLQIERTKILSPLNGVVAKRFASIGEQVDGTAAQPIVEVANIDEVELSGSLPAVYLGRIHVGETLPITSDASSQKTLPGRVVAISPTVDPATNVGSVRIRIANPGGTLKLGMYLNAQVPVETHANALVVPAEAIYHNESGQSRVYKIEGDTAKAVDVKLGIETKEGVEILSGVKEGDIIILTGGYGLGDTTKVKIKS